MADIDMDQMIRDWWANRTDEQRHYLRQEAEDDRMSTETVRLLIDTRCPMGPTGTKWESEPGYHWMWSSTVKAVILHPD